MKLRILAIFSIIVTLTTWANESAFAQTVPAEKLKSLPAKTSGPSPKPAGSPEDQNGKTSGGTTASPTAITPMTPPPDDELAQLRGAKALREADEALRRQMMVISRQLGVTCTRCHTTKSFAANEKVEYRIAKEHMKITQALIDSGFDGKDKRPKATCYMCHRGKIKPDYLENYDPMTMEKKVKE